MSDNKEISEMLKATIAELEIEEGNFDLPISIVPTVSDADNRENDINDDYSFARSTLRTQLQLMDSASRSALIAVMASQHPKTIEAFSALMTTMANTAEKLLKTQKDIRDIKGGGKNVTPQAGVGFRGTTTDLLSELGDAQDPKYVIEHDET